MDTTLQEAKAILIRLLDDVEVIDQYLPYEGEEYKANLLKDSIHAALDAITVRLWKPAILEITTSTEEAVAESNSYDLPTGLIEVEAVYDEHLTSFIPKIDMLVGENILDPTGNAWYLYPDGRITFVTAVSDSMKVFYSSLWSKPVNDEDALEPPGISLTPIILYAASYCMLPSSVTSSNIRQYNTKVDSGRPVDNPRAEQSNFFLRRFEIALQQIPKMQKGST